MGCFREELDSTLDVLYRWTRFRERVFLGSRGNYVWMRGWTGAGE